MQADGGRTMLVKALREEVGVPIHFHTHDIGGIQAASVLQGAEPASTSPTAPSPRCPA